MAYSRFRRCLFVLWLGCALGFGAPVQQVQAATITVINNDSAGEGFNDSTPRAATGNNPGTTLGTRRLFAFQFAADLLGQKIESEVEIRVLANFSRLQCQSNSATLGQAGPQASTVLDTPEGETFFPIALANALTGRDLAPPGNNFGIPETDIGAQFNGAIDNNNNCLQGIDWYYGVDGNPPSFTLEFLSTVSHELIHGLGFTAFTDLESGRLPNENIPGIFDRFIRDLDLDALWPDLTEAQRRQSATNTGRVVWNGPNATANGAPTLSQGTQDGQILLYTPSPLEGGSSVSHWDTSLFPNAVMEPFETGDDDINSGLGLATCLLQDIGWELPTGVNCPDQPGAAAPQLNVNPGALEFTATTVGESATRFITLTNQGTAELIIQNLVAPGTPFLLDPQSCGVGTELAPGEDCSLSIQFAPEQAGDFSDALGIASNAGDRAVDLSGEGQPAPAPVIEVAPTTVDFGAVAIGSQANRQITVSNTGSAGLEIGAIGGASTPFSIAADQDNCSNRTLNADTQCTFTAIFEPIEGGSFSATANVPSNDQNVSVSLSGSAEDAANAQISVDPATVDFAAVNTGDSADARVTVSNQGTADLTIQSIQLPAAPFSVFDQSCNAATTLPPGDNCFFDLRFSPTSVGQFNGQLQVGSDGGNAVVALAGEGVQAAAAIVAVTPDAVAFGEQTLGSLSTIVVTVANNGNAELQIASIDGLGAPFGLPSAADNCSGQTLAGAAQCEFSVTYEPSSAGVSNDNLSITTDDQNVSVAVSGTGRAAPTPSIEIEPGSLNFADVAIGSTATASIVVRNVGSSTLSIGAVPANQAPATPFAVVSEDCANRELAINSSCEIEVTLSPQTTGLASDTLDIASNDPDRPNVVVSLQGRGVPDEDLDGVPDSIENAAPNGGDGNEDGTLDSLQPAVVSLPGVRGGFATLATSAGVLEDVRALEAPSRIQLPDGVSFNNGFFGFTVSGITPGSRAQVTLFLNGASAPDSYFKYNEATQGSTSAVRFDFDSVSGTGATIDGNRIQLNLMDGGRGDADLTADGQIIDPGAPGTAAASGGGGGAAASGGGGGGGGCALTSRTPAKDPLLPLLLMWALGALLLRSRRSFATVR